MLFITERAVFELHDGHLMLIEVAPGIDIEKDIFAHMNFRPLMSPTPKTMPAEILQPKWDGLKANPAAKSSKQV